MNKATSKIEIPIWKKLWDKVPIKTQDAIVEASIHAGALAVSLFFVFASFTFLPYFLAVPILAFFFVGWIVYGYSRDLIR